MKRAIKIWLTVTSCLVLTVSIVFCIATIIFTKIIDIQSLEFEVNTYDLTQDFKDISIEVGISNVDFVRSPNKTGKVVFYEAEEINHSVSIEDGTLKIKAKNSCVAYMSASLDTKSPKITLYLPQAEYDSLVVKTSSGNVNIAKGLIFKNIDVSSNTGNINYLASKSVPVSSTVDDTRLKG